MRESVRMMLELGPDRDAGAIARALQAERIVVAARHGKLRVSPHFYNTEEDLQRLTVI